MKFLQKKNQAGFTIIEVMIVLAIAGVIMVALFLAVPALQRNSRNNQRSADAALIAAAVNECLASRNGTLASCDTFLEVSPNYLDVSKLRQLSTAPVITLARPTNPTNTATANIGWDAGCASDGATLKTAAESTDRQFAVLFNTESTSGGNILRCLEG